MFNLNASGNVSLAYWQAVLKVYLKDQKEYLKGDLQKFHSLSNIDISDLDISTVKTMSQLEKKINAKIGFLDIVEAYHMATLQTVAENSEYFTKELMLRGFEIALQRETITDLLKSQITKLKIINNKAA